jgi:ribosomal protein S18 acetylase RimI-like enzyme
MLVARDLADYGVRDITLADLEDEWSADSFDLSADAILAHTEDGAIAGYAVIHRRGAMGFVSVDHEGLGIGTRLVHWARKRERELRRPHHGQAIAAGNARARDLLLASGYQYERSFSRMVRLLDGSECEPRLSGVVVRQFAHDVDPRAVHALDELCFAANADFLPETVEEFTGEHLRPRDFAPELSLVVYDAGAMVGFLLARRWSEEAVGFIDLLAVHPRWRQRGIGSALLRTAFARFAADGLREAQLGVASDNLRALQIYERAGMRPRFVIDAYVRELDESATAHGHPERGFDDGEDANRARTEMRP